ncbi:MAG: hypothetical protein WCL54_08640 [Clostridia bacterium]
MNFDIFNFNKPGRGVKEDEPDLPRWRLFFRQFSSKFVQILGLNFLYLVFSIPSLILAYFASFWIIGQSFDQYFGFQYDTNLLEMTLPRVILALLMVFIPAVAIGPVHAGFSFVLRNFSRQRHAYVWWDFKDHALENLKQGFIVTFFNIIVIFLLGLAINTYAQFSAYSSNILTYAAIGFVTIALFIFLSINLYIYPLMISYDMKIKELYRVAYSFAFLRLIPNILLILGITVILILAFALIPAIGVILTLFILPAFVLYTINFFVDPVIKRFEIEQDLVEAEAEEETDLIE